MSICLFLHICFFGVFYGYLVLGDFRMDGFAGSFHCCCLVDVVVPGIFLIKLIPVRCLRVAAKHIIVFSCRH